MKTLHLPSQKKKMHLGREEQEKEVKRLSERKDVFGIQRGEVEKIEENKYLECKELGLCGIMDVLLTLRSGEMIPVDIKYTSYPFLSTGRVKQIIAYSLLLDHGFRTNTRRGIVYYPQQNKQDSIKISISDKDALLKDLERIRNILSSEKIPRKTASEKCDYCGYLKICGPYNC